MSFSINWKRNQMLNESVMRLPNKEEASPQVKIPAPFGRINVLAVEFAMCISILYAEQFCRRLFEHL